MKDAKNTVKTYNQAIKKFKETAKLKDDDDILGLNVKEILNIVNDIYPVNDKSKVVMLSAIQRGFKDLGEDERYEKVNIKKMEGLSSEITKLNNKAKTKDKKGVYTKEEVDKYEKWNVITDKANNFINAGTDNKIEDRLLVGLYTLIPPRRSEYQSLRYSTKPINQRDKGNWIYKSDKGLVLHLGNYKTAKTYGIVEEKLYKLSPRLEKLFEEFIEKYEVKDGEYLFKKVGINNDNSFVARINRLFGRILHSGDETVGINMLRHSFVNDFLSKPRNVEEREKIGFMLGHSPTMMLFYDKRDSKGEIPS
jgi:hypothetical protein